MLDRDFVIGVLTENTRLLMREPRLQNASDRARMKCTARRIRLGKGAGSQPCSRSDCKETP
jgi:hypothetical protein